MHPRPIRHYPKSRADGLRRLKKISRLRNYRQFIEMTKAPK